MVAHQPRRHARSGWTRLLAIGSLLASFNIFCLSAARAQAANESLDGAGLFYWASSGEPSTLPADQAGRAFAGDLGPAVARFRLVDWLKAHVIAQFPDENNVEKYNRRKHFGGWIREGGGTCYDTRAKVLIRDAEKGSVEFKNDNPCVVDSGVWKDPYTATEFDSAKEVQIDHVVPLHHAWYAGAYQWRFKQRCRYANFLENSYHLLAVSGHENMKKGDHGPDGYLPPNRAFQCAYVGVWMKIKAIWNLQADGDEVAAIEQVERSLNCDDRTQTMEQTELEQMRANAAAVTGKCDRPDPKDDRSEASDAPNAA